MRRLTVEQIIRQGDMIEEAREEIISILNRSNLSKFNARSLIGEIYFDLMTRVI